MVNDLIEKGATLEQVVKDLPLVHHKRDMILPKAVVTWFNPPKSICSLGELEAADWVKSVWDGGDVWIIAGQHQEDNDGS